MLRLVLTIVVLISCVIILAFTVQYQPTERQDQSISTPSFPITIPKFLIDTEGCKIPYIHPFDESLLHFTVESKSINCSSRIPSLTTQTLNTIKLNKRALGYYRDVSHCEYVPIIKPKNASTKNYSFLEERRDKFYTETVVDFDFNKVECFSKKGIILYSNFHAFVIPKERIARHNQDSLNADKHRYNVLLLGIDSLSRSSFLRNLPTTRTVLLEKLGAVELLGYNKVGDNTFPNIVPFTLGISVRELRKLGWKENVYLDKFNFIWNRFAKQGYATLFAEDMIDIAIFNHLKAGFADSPVDHFYHTMSAAIESKAKEKSNHSVCVGGKIAAQKTLDYVSDFLSVYTSRNCFALCFLTRLFHNPDKSIKESDFLLSGFLEKFIQQGHNKNTILIVFSDHGSRFGPVRRSPVGRLEARLPAAYIALPQSFTIDETEVSENLRPNSHRLTTPYDMHETLLDILYQTRTRPSTGSNGISLFNKIPQNRTCKMAGIANHWCACGSLRALNISTPFVRQISNFMLEYVNSLLLRHIKECERLVLHQVLEISELYTTQTSSNNHRDFVIKIETVPGGALLESTVLYRNGILSMTKDSITRLNMYSYQSECVNEFPAKKLCYCKKRVGM